MNDIETVERIIREECAAIADMLAEKNRKYGNAAIKPVRTFSNLSPIERLNVRMDDKLQRIANRQDDEDEDPEKDLLGYLVLKRVMKRLMAQKAARVAHEVVKAAELEASDWVWKEL